LFALFPFVSGREAPVWSAAGPELRDRMARALASLHRATASLVEQPPVDDFAIPFDAALVAALDAAEQIPPTVRPGLLALRDLIRSTRVEIDRQLEALHDLQPQSRRLPCSKVLCHSDFNGDNLLIDERGELVVLDWDEAVVAPPEHDLKFAVGPGFAPAVRAYQDAGGSAPLHVEHFAFYMLRRAVEDMCARLVRMLHGASAPGEDEELLEGMRVWGFERWRALDRTLDELRAVIMD
jgi:hypothetical protein